MTRMRLLAVLGLVLGLALVATPASAQIPEVPGLPGIPGLPDPGGLPELPGLPGGEGTPCAPTEDALLVCTFATPAESPVQGTIVITVTESGVDVQIIGGSDGDAPGLPDGPLPEFPGIPGLDGIPGPDDLPAIPGLDGLPEVPGLPDIPLPLGLSLF